jgi:hypothetical protein
MDEPIYEFCTTEGGRKTWDGEPDLAKEGWEEYQEWERFGYTEERYWRRPLCGDALEKEMAFRAWSAGRDVVKETERKVIEAAKALLVDDCPLQQRVDRVVDTTQALLAAEKEKP